MDDEERFRKSLRPRGLLRWLSRWDTEALISGIFMFVAMVVVIFYALSLIPTSADAKQHALDLLRAQGYTDIRVEDVNVFACGHGDVPNESAAFRALTVSGIRVEGEVCCGWAKGCTIRYK